MAKTKEEKALATAERERLILEKRKNLPIFSPWPKIARLNREIVITEKIDGTNAAVIVTEDGQIFAQSRSKVIIPEDDNYGFAAWVEKHRDTLINLLGEGTHFGEWFGVGIQRGYGLSERRFALFDSKRWANDDGEAALSLARAAGCAIYHTPVLFEGEWFDEIDFSPDCAIRNLQYDGSKAAPGFMDPEGIVVYHKAGDVMFKVTCENDEKAKGDKSV